MVFESFIDVVTLLYSYSDVIILNSLLKYSTCKAFNSNGISISLYVGEEFYKYTSPNHFGVLKTREEHSRTYKNRTRRIYLQR